MRVYAFALVVVCCFLCPLYAAGGPKPDDATSSSIDKSKAAQMAAGEQRLGDQIRAILKHYQQVDPVGLPGAPIPDPMPVPDMKHSFSVYTMNFKQTKVLGLSKFRIEHVESELARMQVSVSVRIDILDIRGLYTLTSWFTKSEGDFTVKLTDVSVQGIARLEVATDGKLQAQNIDMDLTFDKIDMDFKNLGFLGSVFQGLINSVGTFMFDSVKPFILKEVNTNVRGEVNKQISQLPQYFPNSISPFDMAVAEARKQVRQMGYDPYRVPDYTQSAGIFTVTSSHTWVTGLASFYRMGNITITMEKGNVYALLDIGTQELEGKTHWELSVIGGIMSRAGKVSFTVQYFRVQVKLGQPLDTRKRASLEELEFELGNIQARIHGTGTLDYLVEASINILPNLLRYQIMDAIEGPVKRHIQEKLDSVDVEKLIHDKIPEIEEQARWIQGIVPVEETVLEETSTSQDPDSQGPFSESEENRGPS
ncbi:PREDICTED: uncharacterized protein LOC106747710 isoform X3 [Dinoponera quadriceps]|uniref:Uncharacterized protein LOC106747710 isoform X3 n=1 Tax=Dinoponera quadriceps TaxID=609295 RepID=A0A6P3XR65_DINQU|nr:PREDICTED: uncharacterized protein LOC106747710 isoform X3 [Dinoponera quadriceps]